MNLNFFQEVTTNQLALIQCGWPKCHCRKKMKSAKHACTAGLILICSKILSNCLPRHLVNVICAPFIHPFCLLFSFFAHNYKASVFTLRDWGGERRRPVLYRDCFHGFSFCDITNVGPTGLYPCEWPLCGTMFSFVSLRNTAKGKT